LTRAVWRSILRLRRFLKEPVVMLDLIGPFVFGFAGSVHCLGMCGPIIVAYSLNMNKPVPSSSRAVWPKSAGHHLAFHAGRLFTYGLLGATAAGLAGAAPVASFRGAVTVAAGAAMVLLGLCLGTAGAPRFPRFPDLWAGRLTGRFLVPFFSSGSLASKLPLGLAAGFLPCMLSMAMIIKAAATGLPLHGFLTMFSFGLGTTPVLLLTGLSASLLSLRARLLGRRMAGAAALAMGLILILKGMGR